MPFDRCDNGRSDPFEGHVGLKLYGGSSGSYTGRPDGIRGTEAVGGASLRRWKNRGWC